MSERSKLISRLTTSRDARKAYIKSKLSVLVPAQIRALRLKFDMPTQTDLAKAVGMHQSRVSMLETPGANITLDTLSRIAAALHVALVVRFVPFSEMLRWDNGFSQDHFRVTRLQDDKEFLGEENSIDSQAKDLPNRSLISEEVTADTRGREFNPTQALTIDATLLARLNSSGAGITTNDRQSAG